jgi:hypothetical protein
MIARSYIKILGIILVLVATGLSACDAVTQTPPSEDGAEPAEAANPPDGEYNSSDFFSGEEAILFEWNEIPPGGGIHFDGTFLACPTGAVTTTVSIYGDLGGGVVLNQGGVNREDILLMPLVEDTILVHRTQVDLDGTIIDPECQCTINQSIELEFEIDLNVRNAWIKDATGKGQEIACECPGAGAAVPLMEFWFPRDILVDLEFLDVEGTDCDL